MKKIKENLILVFLLVLVTGLASTASADTVAYWRFESTDPGISITPANNVIMPNTSNGTIWKKAAHDYSGNGNHLGTYGNYYGLRWVDAIPENTIPLTGATNTLGAANLVTGNPDGSTFSSLSLPSGIDIGDTGTWTPAQWTIEASFYADTDSGGYRTIIGRDGAGLSWNGTPGHLNYVAALYLTVRPGNQLATEFTDVNGVDHVLESELGLITEGQWYHTAIVSDGETLSMYLADVEQDTGYQLVGQLDLTDSGSTNTAMAHGTINGTGWWAGNFTVGRGLYNSAKADYFDGYIDEIRISDTALSPSQFLFQKRATEPFPADDSPYGAIDVNLSWTPASTAAEHDVYFGTDFNDVNNAIHDSNEYMDTVDTNSYFYSGLERGKTYYWRIDEVNDANILKGPVWSFLAMPTKAWEPGPYNDKFCVSTSTTLSWNAGAESSDSDVYFGTSPGSLVHQTTVTHTEGVLRYSYPKSGLSNNQNYYWRIDEVPTGGGSPVTGDVWHFKTIPVITQPDTHLVGWWKFDEGLENAIDWSGNNQHGTVNGATSAAGYDGNSVKFDGTNDYISLPIGATISTLDSATIATWVNFTNTGGPWQRIFDFGNGTTTGYMFLTPRLGTTGVMRFAITATGNEAGAESIVDAPDTLSTGWHHVAISLDEDLATITMFIDSVPVPTAATDTVPSDLGSTVNNWLGRSQWPADAYFSGMLDDFRIYDFAMTQAEIKQVMAPKEAWLPYPADRAERVYEKPTLFWDPGKYADKHDVYFDVDVNDVRDANRANHPGLMYYSQNQDANSYAIPSDLNSITTYYWRIDEVNDSNIWQGNVWSFTTRDLKIIDDFESYTETGFPRDPGTLRLTWIDGSYGLILKGTIPAYPESAYSNCGLSGAFVELASDPCDGTTNPISPALDGDESMKLYYDNDGQVTWNHDLHYYDQVYWYCAPMYSEALAAIVDAGRLSTSHESRLLPNDFSVYKLLKVGCYGDPTNTIVASDKLYVTLQDVNGTAVTISNPDQTIIQKVGWENWYIKMSDFASNPNLDLTNIVRIYVGIGNKSSPVSGGTGAVFLDEIKLFSEAVCIPGYANIPEDFDNNCKVDENDLEIMTMNLYGDNKPVSLPTPIIDLDASTIAVSVGEQVTTWNNTGSMSGAFRDFNTLDTNAPILSMIEGKKAVTFSDINDLLIWDYNAPATLTGDANEPNDFTVVLEVFNVDIGVEEWVLAWAERSLPNGSFAAFGYGTHEDWGAAAHFGTDYDMGFGVIGAPAAHTWHTIAFTYDGTTESIIVDGLIYDQEDKELIVEANQPVVIGGVYEPNSAAGPGSIRDDWQPVWATTDWTMRYIGSVASIKVYAESIPAKDLALWFGSPADLFNDNKLNFKDYAVFATKWLVGPILFGD